MEQKEDNIIAENLKDILFDYTILEEYREVMVENPTFQQVRISLMQWIRRYYGLLVGLTMALLVDLLQWIKGMIQGRLPQFIGIEDEVCYGNKKREMGYQIWIILIILQSDILLLCDVAHWYVLVTSWAIYDVKYNIAESMTVVGKYMAVQHFSAIPVLDGFYFLYIRTKFINKLKQNFGKVGVAEALSKLIIKSLLTLTHNLIGYPEFEMDRYSFPICKCIY